MATTEHSTSRRALILGLAGTPFLAGTMAAAISTSAEAAGGDRAILAAWEARQAALARIEASGCYFDAEARSPEDVSAFDTADEAITLATATTPRGALAQAWVALSYTQDSFSEVNRAQNALIRRADFAALAADDSLDWELKTLLAVIRSLRLMSGEA